MRRRSIVALFLLGLAGTAVAKNVGEWTADLLRDVVAGYNAGRGADGKYHVLVLYRTESGRLLDTDLRHPEITAVQEMVNSGPRSDLYTQVAGLFGSEYFHCVVIADLLPQQVLVVEQFARDYGQTHPFGVVLVSLVADMPGRGRMPFAFDPDKRAGFVRIRALGTFHLAMRTMPPKHPLVLLDHDAPFEELDRCSPLEPRTKGSNPEVICNSNAYKMLDSPSRDAWANAIVDLEVAVLHVFDEELDHRKYPRGWGREGYHPHVGLADYLSRFGYCAAVRRELSLARFVDDPAAGEERRKVTERLQKQCSSVASHLAGGGVPLEPGFSFVVARAAPNADPELLPPLRPALVWGDAFWLR